MYRRRKSEESFVGGTDEGQDTPQAQDTLKLCTTTTSWEMREMTCRQTRLQPLNSLYTLTASQYDAPSLE